MKIVKVFDRYDKAYYVSADDLAGDKTQLRLFTRAGARLYDYFEKMNWHGRSTTIHRGNILRVQS